MRDRERLADASAMLWRLGAIVVVLVGCPSAISAAPRLSPYLTFRSLSQDDLRTVQVKLTYVGAQTSMTTSLLFTESSNKPDIDLFRPFRRRGVFYGNDDFPPSTVNVSLAELKAVIDGVGSQPRVTAGGVAERARFSFALFSAVSGGVAFEAVLDHDASRDLFDHLRRTLPDNAAAIRELSWRACAHGVTESTLATDVTGSVAAHLSGLRRKRDTPVDFVGALTLENTGGRSIPGPVSVALHFSDGRVRLVTDDGMTCKFAPAGRRFINVPLAAKALAPGQRAEVAVAFHAGDFVEPRPAVQVLAGPGAR